ncbi:SDR family NAD(P)-dependent oxidoreductase [Streptomyces chartreusis]|uniref:SDR family NAD(P)-dependent oxidoreductase n=1 Tax=Streptomyces chartreusis TaxID=1969 RepID=UPI002E81639A|nr:SDR family oxidoreductase [Streptomyces chartreusis]WUB18114.1 SDR family oxidoreductase [Streptomyces chartreusis]
MNTKRALTDKIALVTGAGRGIGRGIAERLADDGALVGVHYGRSEAAALDVIAGIRDRGGRAFPIGAELGVPGDVDAVFAAFDAGVGEQTGAAGGAVGTLDILVNNAGVSGSGPIGKADPEVFDRMIAVNAKAPFFLVQGALARMRDGGRVVNISSLASRRAFPESVAYAMSKGALDTMTLALAKELAGRGITVNTVSPGFIETDMNARRRATPEARAALAARSAFDRIGRPSDVADVVAFLASDDSRWITGQYLDVSGGTDL